LALLVQHVAELGFSFTGNHLIAAGLMLRVALIVFDCGLKWKRNPLEHYGPQPPLALGPLFQHYFSAEA
jgi:hypothetical protein